MRLRLLAVAAAALLPAHAPSAQEVPVAADVFDAFLAAEAEDIEACFGDLPELEQPGEAASFRAADGALPVPPRRLVLAVDASGSMAGGFGSESKMDAARGVVADLLGSLPEDVESGLVVFGHEGTNDDSGQEESCAGIDAAVAPSAEGAEAIGAALDALAPTGWTPLAAAMEAAGRLLLPAEAEGEQVIYVVSDGRETCGGDPVATARRLNEGPARVVVNVLGFDLPEEDRAELAAVAEAGGGLFSDLRTESDVARRSQELRRQNANFTEMLRKQNQVSIRTLRNQNRTSITLLRLGNCVNGRARSESNALYRFARGRDDPPAIEEEVRALLEARHAAFKGRVADIEDAAEAALGAANEALQDNLDAATEAYEAVEP